ncbi:MAG: C4-dicarboxylate transporter DcuC [Bacteroidales bacterium]|nr:C4-dicarboxylate transporter DcuC [Bacteroidales bacterium]
MTIVAFALCIVIIAVIAVMLYRKFNPQGVLLIAGLLMVCLALILGVSPVDVTKPTGSAFFDIFKYAEEKFVSNFSRAGLMIMVIGGYVAFMNKIQATNMLVYLAIKPLAVFKKYPYLAMVLAIPIGQLLFMTTPSAAGVGLLLVATLYPILVNLGVSKISALSVIAAATLFDQGPGSANTAAAAALVDLTPIQYFIQYQIPTVIPVTLLLMAIYYWYNKRCDKRDLAAGKEIYSEKLDESKRPEVPAIFAFLPLLPIVLLVVFSSYIGLFDVNLGTTVAMLVSLLVAMICVAIHGKSYKAVFTLFPAFWQGMGNVFASVVTLIVCAEIFSGGLISLGFIDTLVAGSTSIGMGGVAISIVIVSIIFLAAMMMGSGNAAFFSFGPLVPGIATQLGMPAVDMVLPMQLAASMGRATSPIAGVIVAICGVAGVPTMDLAKRNLVPLTIGVTALTLIHFFIY